MHRILSISLIPVLAILLFGTVFALPAEAQIKPIDSCTLVDEVTLSDGTKIPKSTVVTSTSYPKTWGTICLINTVNNIANWIFNFLVVLAILLIAIAGFFWMTSGSDASRQKTAGAMVVAALIGLVIAMLAKLLPNTILTFL